ncbi:TetR/AcrR family transcriptional regulator [Dyella caseinilytica]|uniref:TetR/AcrR family transcriptional regulator n=1 Tax=Dyella caseinilytica TaxID=1849581 RepID=A0ABX7GS71_9GAMM|nr:TetR/AcrR family transcriptional regulator [Dyella caseinilytica]QRN53276.1 TetR/AcrR family transcriptional regulator [Dyella caseinilytica]GGA12809.1 TetR family transcriptional regulator [Dyella caseinilytica]
MASRSKNAPAQRTSQAGDPPASRRPGRPSGSVNGLEQRNRLLDTALVLFARQGIVDTSLSAIAREAGVTAAMLHYYFKTRDQLLDVLIEERIQPRRIAIGKTFDINTGDPVTVITQLTERLMKTATEHPWFPALWMREVLSDNGILRQRIQQRYGTLYQQSIVDCIAHWQAEGKLNRDFEPSLLFMSILGLTIMPLIAIKAWQSDPLRSKLGPADIARHAVAIISHGVSPKS